MEDKLAFDLGVMKVALRDHLMEQLSAMVLVIKLEMKMGVMMV